MDKKLVYIWMDENILTFYSPIWKGIFYTYNGEDIKRVDDKEWYGELSNVDMVDILFNYNMYKNAKNKNPEE